MSKFQLLSLGNLGEGEVSQSQTYLVLTIHDLLQRDLIGLILIGIRLNDYQQTLKSSLHMKMQTQ